MAQRTSPTNIGLWLTAAQVARDFGYLTTDEFVRRCAATFETIDRLERHEGHLLNWYNTKTLAPLPPKYVSTVDSGNLIASLWVMARGCEELTETPILKSSLDGLSDIVAILGGLAGEDPSIATALNGLRSAARPWVRGIEIVGRLRLAAYYIEQSLGWKGPSSDARAYWTTKLVTELKAWVAVMDRYMHWMEVPSEMSDQALLALGPSFVQLRRDALRDLPSFAALAGGTPEPLDTLFAKRNTPELRPEWTIWLDAVHREYTAARANAIGTVRRLRDLAERSNRLAGEINMAVLYDPERRLFGTGSEQSFGSTDRLWRTHRRGEFPSVPTARSSRIRSINIGRLEFLIWP